MSTGNYLVAEYIAHNTITSIHGEQDAALCLAVDIACCVARGVPWLGRDVEQGHVFFISDEIRLSIDDAVEVWHRACGMSVEGVPMQTCTPLGVTMHDMSLVDLISPIKALIRQTGEAPSLIVINGLPGGIGATDVNAFTRYLRELQERRGLAVIVVHIGAASAALRDKAGAEYEVIETGKVVQMVPRKMTDAELPAPVEFRLPGDRNVHLEF
jgi:putative DNA primase/helicase